MYPPPAGAGGIGIGPVAEIIMLTRGPSSVIVGVISTVWVGLTSLVDVCDKGREAVAPADDVSEKSLVEVSDPDPEFDLDNPFFSLSVSVSSLRVKECETVSVKVTRGEDVDTDSETNGLSRSN